VASSVVNMLQRKYQELFDTFANFVLPYGLAAEDVSYLVARSDECWQYHVNLCPA
jgi:hypothetical protein